MKKIKFLLVLCCMIIFTASKEKDPDKFTIVVLPDTQYYTDDDRCGEDKNIYWRQVDWISTNKDIFNIKFVAHMGDVTNNSYQYMWEIAHDAHQILHQAGIPFGIVLGNHDYDDLGNTYLRKTPDYNMAFDEIASGDPSWDDTGFNPPWYNSHMGDDLDNTYTKFEVSENLKFLVLNLEYAPTKDALCWADEIINMPEHQYHRVIVVTHCYMDTSGNRCICTDEPKNGEPPIIGSDGWNLWDELVQRHSNIFMVLCGHKSSTEYRQRTGIAGNVIHEILTDYQYEPNDGSGRCGNGWLRLLEFCPDDNRIDIRTLSVEEGDNSIFGSEGTSVFYNNNKYSLDPAVSDHQYSVFYNMTTPTPANVHTPLTEHFNDRTVNYEGTGNQITPAIAMDPSGNFVVVWEDSPDDGDDIYMRGFSPGGCADLLTNNLDIKVNYPEISGTMHPAIAMGNDGHIVVAWTDKSNTNDIYLRRYYTSGNLWFGQYLVNDETAGNQDNAALDINSSKRIVVVWEDNRTGNFDIWARVYGYDGWTPITLIQPFCINSDQQAGDQRYPDVILKDNGEFVVVWTDEQGDADIEYCCFDEFGVALMGEEEVNGSLAYVHTEPAIAMTPTEEFVVVWQRNHSFNDSQRIWARQFSSGSTPTPINDPFEVYPVSNLDQNQRNPAVAINSLGNFVVTWEDEGSVVNGYYQIYGREYSASGTPLFDQITINSEGSGQQLNPTIAMAGNGNFCVAWEDNSDGNDFTDILARGIQHYTISATSIGPGNVTPDTLSGLSGSHIDVEALPVEKFSHWTGDVKNPFDNSTEVLMDRNRTITAWFGSVLDLKVMLEGPYDGIDMRTDINTILPLNHPYSTGPWFYNGDESVTSMPPNVVDWVLVGIMEVSEAETKSIVERKAGFILNDGKVVDLDGSSPLRLDETVSGYLYTAVWHRNHISIMSANPLPRSNGIYQYDYTTNEFQTFGNINSVKDLASSGTWGMIAGDENADGFIDSLDFDGKWAPLAGMSVGYISEDFNMDMEVNNMDKNDSWAINYGDSSTITDTWECGLSLTDSRDGQQYATIQIGSQCWMAENLNIGTRINSENDQSSNGVYEKYCYDNLPHMCNTYGGLYQWGEAMSWVTTPGTKGNCPDGWHIPTDDEWIIMASYLGGVSVAGGKLKETGTIHWNSPNTGATNETGFTALPGGYFLPNGTYENVNEYAYWWTSSSLNTNAYCRFLYYNDAQLHQFIFNPEGGFSVRCLKDD